MTTGSERYTVISADSHAGGDIADFRRYLPTKWHDEFDRWAVNAQSRWDEKNNVPGREVERNWDSDRRVRDLEADGIVAEVIFPNTIPPFYPGIALAATLPETPEDYERRLAGIQANNRWTVDFCAEAPGRRRGVVQILLNDVDDALAEIRWGKEHDLAAILIPGVRPGHPLEGLWSDRYDPIWALADELDLPVNQHVGAGAPELVPGPTAWASWGFEVRFYSQRSVWNLIFGGVFERFPRARFITTEDGLDWIGPTLKALERHYDVLSDTRVVHHRQAGAAVEALSLRPTDYVQRNCFMTVSGVAGRDDIETRDDLGVGHVMWGSDYPHEEGTNGYSREALRALFHDVPVEECRQILSTTAAELYGFDLDALAPIAQRIGPTVQEVRTPLTSYPPESTLQTYLGKLPDREPARP